MKMKRADSCGRAGGGALLSLLRDEIDRCGLRGSVSVRPSPCLDCCGNGPALAIYDDANREFSRPPDGLLGFFLKRPRIETNVTPERARALLTGEGAE